MDTLFFNIALYLDVNNIKNYSLINKYFYNTFKNNYFWSQYFYVNNLPIITIQVNIKNWINEYIKIKNIMIRMKNFNDILLLSCCKKRISFIIQDTYGNANQCNSTFLTKDDVKNIFNNNLHSIEFYKYFEEHIHNLYKNIYRSHCVEINLQKKLITYTIINIDLNDLDNDFSKNELSYSYNENNLSNFVMKLIYYYDIDFISCGQAVFHNLITLEQEY